MANDDLILVLDEDLLLTLDDASGEPLVLVDDIPHAQHYTEYKGRYDVTPILYDEQELRTENKLMKRNVTVRAIPVTDTVNPYGGRTIVIG